MTEHLPGPEREAILQCLRRLEGRIARIENHLGMLNSAPDPIPNGATGSAGMQEAADNEAELEQRIGEFGLAWAGSIVFLLGFVFLMTFTLNQGYSLLSAVMGYAAAVGIHLLARLWQRSFFYLARILVSASLLLGYYTTLRLHYYTASPLIGNGLLALILLLAFAVLPLLLALKTRSQAQALPAVLLVLMTALLSEHPHLVLSIATLLTVLAVFLALRHSWWRFLNLTICLVYLAHLLWLINDPLAGHPVQAVAPGQYPLAYLFFCAAVFALPALYFTQDAFPDPSRIAVVLLNCLGFSTVLSLAVLVLYARNLAPIALGAFGLLLVCSAAQWLKTHLQFAASVYACVSYVALTAAIYGYARIPDAFLWLALQSFLVVSMALWFRSRTLVVMNAVIYFGLLSAYWVISPASDWVNFSFAVVALLSARVMNWQKERLTLRTDWLRNTYLAATFLMVLYALYHAIPPSYVALSWTLTAVGYFLLSLLLRNVKYRWMSLFTLLATVIYLFLVDLARLDPKFRVVAFLFLGLMAVGISLFYARLRRRAAR